MLHGGNEQRVIYVSICTWAVLYAMARLKSRSPHTYITLQYTLYCTMLQAYFGIRGDVVEGSSDSPKQGLGSCSASVLRCGLLQEGSPRQIALRKSSFERAYNSLASSYLFQPALQKDETHTTVTISIISRVCVIKVLLERPITTAIRHIQTQ